MAATTASTPEVTLAMDMKEEKLGRLPVIVRPATRADIPTTARLQAVTFSSFAMIPHILPGLHAYPQEYIWTTTLRHRSTLVDPELFFFVAADASTGEVVGYSFWSAKHVTLPEKWSRERGRLWWYPLESKLMEIETEWHKYIYDRLTDHRALARLVAGDDEALGEYKDVPQLHLRHLVVAPEAQGRGVGRTMLKHGLEVAEALGVPVSLMCAAPEAQFLYDKMGFRVLQDVVVKEEGRGDEVRLPEMLWEPPSKD